MNGGEAVELFFIISGFYMALVCSGKYSGQLALFYTNRLLRLAPTYFLVLGLQLIFLLGFDTVLSVSKDQFFKAFNASLLNAVTLVITNIAVVGQEFLSFFSVNQSAALVYDPGQIAQGTPASVYLLIPQAWSISFELMFYLLAPFFARNKSALAIALLLSYVLHKALILSDLPYNSWGRRIFPAELHFFLLGMAAYFLSKQFSEKLKQIKPRYVLYAAVVLMSALLATRGASPLVIKVYYPALAIGFAAFVPVLFYAVRNPLDRYLGELSYPIYISHYLVIGVLSKGFHLSGYTLMICAVGTVMTLSALIYTLIDRNIDVWRQKRIERESGTGDLLQKAVTAS